MHLLKSYINFLRKSQNQHGLHSPFVYELVTKCFYDKKNYPAYTLLEEYRKSLFQNNKKIEVTDFGAGSRVFKSNSRKISAIAKNAGITKKKAKLLFRLVNYLKCKNALELGTSLGIATSALAANQKTSVTTIEGCPETAKTARQRFEKFGFNNISLETGKFEEVFKKWRVESGEGPGEIEKRIENRDKRRETRDKRQETGNRKQETGKTTTYDLVFFDGNHQKQPTLDYFRQTLPFAHNDSVFIFDDIHWSSQMEAAWEEIKKHPAVTVSIDTFYWGLIFFRREQAKQHFVIRL
ncbi:class I SAM-dependent methyltransferase [Zunongwangia sp. F363]|uniref:Class I SAM-dependent methyltransferase n=1 Tax=Autumnicola tepida TaxID=3075595 RepID=A0ABU3CDM4_9FLAO|nr:class I SAM-dependent methyltransferase [Zunongwangia sp. F363]MDT0644401.1 class I SAM-dependent methyltransferase [Zunongwangia sp. F363]